MLKLIEAKIGRLSLLRRSDDAIGSVFIERARQIFAQYINWRDGVLRRLSSYEARGINSLTSTEVQYLFELREMHVAQLRHRGVFAVDRDGHEYRYPIQGLRDLVNQNGIDPEGSFRPVRGPLTYSFLRWLGQDTDSDILIDVAYRGVMPSPPLTEEPEEAVV